MISIGEIFQKIGIKGYDDLKEAEKATYKGWEAILTKPDVTIDDLKKLLPVEIEKAKAELLKYDNSTNKDLFHKAYLRLLETITAIIITPQKEKAALEQQLRQRFKI